jgi:hypothetical protein
MATLDHKVELTQCPEDLALFFEAMTYGFSATGPLLAFYRARNVPFANMPIEVLEAPSDTTLTPAWKYLITKTLVEAHE